MVSFIHRRAVWCGGDGNGTGNMLIADCDGLYGPFETMWTKSFPLPFTNEWRSANESLLFISDNFYFIPTETSLLIHA